MQTMAMAETGMERAIALSLLTPKELTRKPPKLPRALLLKEKANEYTLKSHTCGSRTPSTT
jgi:hypothetical protein